MTQLTQRAYIAEANCSLFIDFLRVFFELFSLAGLQDLKYWKQEHSLRTEASLLVDFHS